MSNPPLIPRCGYFGRQHELQDEIHRNRARFRRRTKPYLRRVLCHCTQPWDPEPDSRPQSQRAFWMRVHALAIDATALRAEMAERYPARVVELYGRG